MRKSAFVLWIVVSICLSVQGHADDTSLFVTSTSPDALIILDLSTSMDYPPQDPLWVPDAANCTKDYAGKFFPTSGDGHTSQCFVLGNPNFGGTNLNSWYSQDSTCSSGYYRSASNAEGYNINCSKLEVAKRTIKVILDDNKDETVDCRDDNSLKIRLGYMRFLNVSPSSGSPEIRVNIPNDCPSNPYQCKGNSSLYKLIMDDVNSVTEARGNTPLVTSLDTALSYLNGHKAADCAASCRKKSVILITDGDDTLACDGTGSPTQPDQYKRRRETVAKAKALRDAGFKVFVIGFGTNMPHWQVNTLEWTAFYGGTDNPLSLNSTPTAVYDPGSVTGCQTSETASHALPGERQHDYATSNDPGEIALRGYAYIAQSSTEMTEALKTITQYIMEESFSFTSPTIPSVRLTDQDVLYISSFTPGDYPFWQGNLKAFRLNPDGTLPVDEKGDPLASTLIWDAGEKLKVTNPDDRKIFTGAGVGSKEFKSTNLTSADLGAADDQERDRLINHVRGIDAFDLNKNGNTTEAREWKLGDIFHSNAVIVGEPSRFFKDRGFSGPNEFYELNKDRKKIVMAGANDGMLHAFDAATGIEEWAFIPNSLLKNLKSMVSAHTYYVDSSPKVADAWFYSTEEDETKTADEWRTVLVCGLRKGGKGYFALNITDTQKPEYLWEFPKSTDTATLAKMGQSWSEPAIGRVKMKVGEKLFERWVAFVGGGFDTSNTGAFFVIDLKTGNALWEFSYDPNPSSSLFAEKKYMKHALAATPTAVDTNFDGYVDKVYIGDLGGQIWVFDVSFDEVKQESNSRWTGRRLFAAPAVTPEKHNVFYQPAVAFDVYGTPWVYFGTGDRENPNDKNSFERFYAVKDDAVTEDDKLKYPYAEKDLVDVGKDGNTYRPADVTVEKGNTFRKNPIIKGWYIKLGKSEKVLAKPNAFDRLIYFTTYLPTEPAVCTVGGESRLYVLEYLSGGGSWLFSDQLYASGWGTPSERYQKIGAGAPSAPVITVDLKGRSSVIVATTTGEIFSRSAYSRPRKKEVLYWREVIR